MEWTSECNEASLSVLFHVPHLSRSIRRRISTNGGMEYEVYDNSHSVNGRSSSSDDWMYVCFECCWGLVRNLLWTLKGPNEYKHKAAGDVLTFYIHTHVWRKWRNLRSLGVLYSKWVQADSFTRGDCARLWYLLFGREADSIGSPISWSNSIEFDNSKSCSSIDRTSDRREDEREGIAFVTEQQPTLYEEVWNRMTVEEQLFYSNAVCSLERSWNVLEGLQSLEELLYLVHLGSIEQLV